MKVRFLKAWGPFTPKQVVEIAPLTAKKLIDANVVEEFKKEEKKKAIPEIIAEKIEESSTELITEPEIKSVRRPRKHKMVESPEKDKDLEA